MPFTLVRSGKQAKLSVLKTENPGDALSEMVSRLNLKVTISVAVGCDGVIGRHSFEDDQGRTCTMNQANYNKII